MGEWWLEEKWRWKGSKNWNGMVKEGTYYLSRRRQYAHLWPCFSNVSMIQMKKILISIYMDIIVCDIYCIE